MTKQRGRKPGSRNGVYAVRRSREAAERLFLENVKLVGFTVKMMELPFADDTLQDGYIGLWKAALAFDDTQGSKFSGYAVNAIRGEIVRGWKNSGKDAAQELSLDYLASARLNGAQEELVLHDILENPQGGAEIEDAETEIWLRQLLSDTELDVLKRRLHGYGFQEISKANGKNRGWSEHQFKKIKEKMKRDYAERMMNLG